MTTKPMQPIIAEQHFKLVEIAGVNNYLTVLIIGERSTGKTTDACIIFVAKLIENLRQFKQTKTIKTLAIMRQNTKSIKHSIWRAFVNQYQNMGKHFTIAKYTEVQETAIKGRGKHSTNTFVLTKGFKTSEKQSTANAKGLEGVNAYLIDEAEEISKADFEQLQYTAIRENALIVLICNTPHKDHWITQTFLNLQPSKYEGYFDFEARPLSNFEMIRSRLDENPWLSKDIKDNYKRSGDPASADYDLEKYCTNVLGLVASNIRGKIFSKYQSCSLDDFQSIQTNSLWGLDIGFSQDPTVLVEVKIYQGCLYCRQWIYQTGMTTPDIDKRLELLEIPKELLISTDSGGLGQLIIKELQDLGYNVVPSVKGNGSIKAGILKIKEYQVLICEDSSDIIDNFNNYSYILNSNREATQEPKDADNDCIDAIRYAIAGKFSDKLTINLDKNPVWVLRQKEREELKNQRQSQREEIKKTLLQAG